MFQVVGENTSHFENPNFTGESLPDTSQQDLSRRGYFDMFYDELLYSIITVQSTLYTTETTGSSTNTINLEIEQLIGILLTMGILKYPQYRMYWFQYTKCVTISEITKLKQFGNWMQFVHLSDNSKIPKKGTPNYDKV